MTAGKRSRTGSELDSGAEGVAADPPLSPVTALYLLLRCGSCRYAGYYLLPVVPAAVLSAHAAWPEVAAVAVFAVMLTFAGEIANRVADEPEDRTNQTVRTALCERIGYRRLRRVSWALWALILLPVGALMVMVPSAHMALVLMAYMFIGFNYSYGLHLKRRPVPALISLTQPFAGPLLMGLSVDPSAGWISAAEVTFFLVLSAVPFGLVGMKDLTDVRGDEAVGYRSLWIRAAARWPWILGVVAATLPAAVTAVGVAVDLLPARMLALLALWPVSTALVLAGSRARHDDRRWAARELMYYVLLVHAVIGVLLFYPARVTVLTTIGCVGYWLLASNWLHWRPTISLADVAAGLAAAVGPPPARSSGDAAPRVASTDLGNPP